MVRKSGVPARRNAGGKRLRRCFPALAIGALAIGFGGVPTSAQSQFEPEKSFQLLDENGDGAVDRDEFQRHKTEIFFLALEAAGADQLLRPQDVRLTAEVFGQADINDDGLLSGAEFIQAPFMKFESFDADSDGTITLEEFADASRVVVD
jgi:hypothetical protein